MSRIAWLGALAAASYSSGAALNASAPRVPSTDENSKLPSAMIAAKAARCSSPHCDGNAGVAAAATPCTSCCAEASTLLCCSIASASVVPSSRRPTKGSYSISTCFFAGRSRKLASTRSTSSRWKARTAALSSVCAPSLVRTKRRGTGPPVASSAFARCASWAGLLVTGVPVSPSLYVDAAVNMPITWPACVVGLHTSWSSSTIVRQICEGWCTSSLYSGCTGGNCPPSSWRRLWSEGATPCLNRCILGLCASSGASLL